MDPVVADDADDEEVVVVAAEGFDLDFEIAGCCRPLCVKLNVNARGRRENRWHLLLGHFGLLLFLCLWPILAIF
jgi:hypothetical protein